jgi:uncharacterized protein (DUF2062 family)
MARKLLKRFIPSSAAIKDKPGLKFLGNLLHDPNLFHLNRHSVSAAFFVGIFIAFIPTPGQMPLAALAALFVRCNLPIAVALVWITNPVTMPAIFFACYQLGRWMMQMEPATAPFAFTLEWLLNEVRLIWKPFILGCLTSGLVLGTLGYFGMRGFWRWNVVQNWERRKRKRLVAAEQQAQDQELDENQAAHEDQELSENQEFSKSQELGETQKHNEEQQSADDKTR